MEKILFLSILLFSLCTSGLISGCASSDVSRDSASHGDVITQKAKGIFDGADNINIADSYQNSSQMTKGALVGGAIGGGVGALAPRLGFLPGLAAGVLIGAGYGAYIDANMTLQDRLENRGANVIVLGDQVLIVLPSSRLFAPATSTIKPSAYSTLKLLAKYINSYEKMLVKISAYTNQVGPREVNLSLSQTQANQVARYLVAAGVDARVLYAEGYGGTHLVESISREWDGSENYRIEVTLEKLPA